VCGLCNMDRMDLLAFIFYSFNNFLIASTLVCSFCKAIPGSLSVANMQFRR
jgi:hypothetical protein